MIISSISIENEYALYFVSPLVKDFLLFVLIVKEPCKFYILMNLIFELYFETYTYAILGLYK